MVSHLRPHAILEAPAWQLWSAASAQEHPQPPLLAGRCWQWPWVRASQRPAALCFEPQLLLGSRLVRVRRQPPWPLAAKRSSAPQKPPASMLACSHASPEAPAYQLRSAARALERLQPPKPAGRSQWPWMWAPELESVARFGTLPLLGARPV